ncbi:MAG: DUF4294 domain-containing protein [Flavobacteriaceae bacterium]|jgi:hypothetical protein|nr:DUF4294 domain-containing protein [Flavobacteriaceae bacterium]
MRTILFILIFVISHSSFGQQDADSTGVKSSLAKFKLIEQPMIDADSVISKESTKVVRTKDSISVDLMLVNVYGLPKFNNDLDRKYYYWLKDRVYRVYPYFTLAVEQYQNIQDSLELNKNNPKFKEYIKKRQRQLSEEYETRLKNLSKTEGRIFSKLMYKATGKTVYNIIKELRGGWSAFWWNAKAGAFDIDLKQPFDPTYNREDAYIQAIMYRAYQFGDLKPIDYF